MHLVELEFNFRMECIGLECIALYPMFKNQHVANKQCVVVFIYFKFLT